MLMATSILISIQICKYEKYKIIYCDKMIYLASQVSIFMKSVMPDTDMIFSYLKNSEKLKDIDIFDINSTSPLNKVENEKITEYINSIGKYDAQTQIDKSTEFCDSFRIIKKDYQQFYSTHYKLIYAAGFSFGALISILLI